MNKAILFRCLLALVLMLASEVTARDLAETKAVETNGLVESKYPGGGGYPGGGYPGGGRGGGGGGGRCRRGCCGRGNYGRGFRCCSYAGEAVESEPESKPHN